ncbi:MAG: FkbM family methyltransferase [Alphaproteobacteria bacterium]
MRCGLPRMATRSTLSSPIRRCGQRLKKKAAVYGLKGSITLHRTAMGAADESRSFNLPAGTNQGTGSFEYEPYNWEGETAEIRISAASAYIQSLGIDRADLIKIDVEGFEIDVMEGLRTFLSTSRPLLWIEISAESPARWIDLPKLKSYLSGKYRFFRAQPVSPLLTAEKFVETDTIPDGPPVEIIAVPEAD